MDRQKLQDRIIELQYYLEDKRSKSRTTNISIPDGVCIELIHILAEASASLEEDNNYY